MKTTSITLHFTSEEAKRAFIGGWLDAWGENACSQRWEGQAKEATDFLVRMFPPRWERLAASDEDGSALEDASTALNGISYEEFEAMPIPTGKETQDHA